MVRHFLVGWVFILISTLHSIILWKLLWSAVCLSVFYKIFCKLYCFQKKQATSNTTLLIASGHSQTKINLSFSLMVSRILRYVSCLKFVSSRYLFNNKTWSQRSVWYFICGITAQFKCHTLFPPALILMTVNNRGLYERELTDKFQISVLSIITHKVIKYQTMPLIINWAFAKCHYCRVK